MLNKPQPMVILKMDKLRGNIVVSRRVLLEESRKADRSKLLSDINEGDKLKGLLKILLIMESLLTSVAWMVLFM